MYGALIMFEDEFIHIVATELIMVALTIRTWHHIMMLAEIFSLALYLLSLIVLKDYFGKFIIFNKKQKFISLMYNIFFLFF